MSNDDGGYRSPATIELYVPRVHQPKKVGQGLIATFCKKPGWWARHWAGFTSGTVWTCWCGKKWMWVHAYREWEWREVDED